MPKIVDHEARREELAAAVWRIAGRDGLQAASVRAVAAESGWSMGAVRHYFSSQDDLARFAMDVMAQRISTRIVALYRDLATGEPLLLPDPRARHERAREALEQLLPLDGPRRVEVLVWLEFMTRARFDANLDEPRRQSWHGARYICRIALCDALDVDLPPDLVTPLAGRLEQAAAQLHLAIDGLTVQAITYPEHWPVDALGREVKRQLALATAAAAG